LQCLLHSGLEKVLNDNYYECFQKKGIAGALFHLSTDLKTKKDYRTLEKRCKALKLELEKVDPQYKGHEQHDAFELLGTLFYELSECLPQKLNPLDDWGIPAEIQVKVLLNYLNCRIIQAGRTLLAAMLLTSCRKNTKAFCKMK